MYEIYEKIINFITKPWEIGEVELAPGGQTLTEVKIQKDIFHGNFFLRLLLVIAMMPLNYHIYQPLRSGRIWHKVNF